MCLLHTKNHMNDFMNDSLNLYPYTSIKVVDLNKKIRKMIMRMILIVQFLFSTFVIQLTLFIF